LTLKNRIGCVIEILKIQNSNLVAKKEQKDDKPGEGLPKAKVNALNLVNSYQNIPKFVFQVSLKLVTY
jgi:hypothetical protein